MPKLYTIPDAAKLLRCHPDTIRRMIRRQALPDRRIPGTRKYLFTIDDLIPQPVSAQEEAR